MLYATVVFTDPSREPLTAPVKSGYTEDGFVTLNFDKSELPPGVKGKTLHFPAHIVESFEVVEKDRPTLTGYREPSNFREIPGGAKHIPGGKLP